MNLFGYNKANKLDLFFSLFIVSFILAYASVAIPFIYRDTDRSPQLRMQHGWDEGQNVARALSIVQYKYSENPIVSKSLNQFYLMVTAFGQQFMPSQYDLPTRITLLLRLGATISMCLVFIFFYLLCRMATPAIPAFIAWLLFTGASWAYLPIGTVAKEDAFCLWLTICILMSMIQYFRTKNRKVLYFSAILIGIGGATKQYPLLLTVIYPLYFGCSGKSFKHSIVLLTKLLLIILSTMIIVNPNYYLAKFEVDSPMKVIFFGQQSQTGLKAQLVSSWQIIKKIILTRYLDFFTALGLLILLSTMKAQYKHVKDNSYFTLKKYQSHALLFLFIFYGVSLYKQNYYNSVRYFLIGEVTFFFFLAILTDRLLQLENGKLKLLVISIFFTEAFVLNLRRANFNLMLQTSAAQSGLMEKRHSSFEDLEGYLRSLDQTQLKVLLSQWYIYIPDEFNPRYVNEIAHASTEAEVYLGKIYGFRLINASLSEELLKKENATLYLSLIPLHEKREDFIKCFHLLKTIEAEPPIIYPNLYTAFRSFHITKQRTNSPTEIFPQAVGSSVYVYDTRSCY